ncbi:MAG: hypothetical protein AAGJ52_00855 [Pseudomonadota bacterium]
MSYSPKATHWLAFLAGIVLSPVASTCEGEPWISYQVRATQVASLQPAERIEIDLQGCVISEYAEFDRRVGRYTRQLTTTELRTLQTALDAAPLEAVTGAIEEPITGRADQLWTISHSDAYSLTLYQNGEGQRLDWLTEEVDHPAVAARSAIVSLKGLIDVLREFAADPFKNAVDEVSR